ncbi:MAG: hypothetical protein ACTSQO_09230 [Candidatus Helarchaeota archaeon]
MAWDALFKQLMTNELKDFDVRTNVSVGKLPLQIDVVIIKPKIPPKTNILSSFTKYLSKINIIEFKSTHDVMKNADLTKLIGYVGLYCNSNDLGIQDLNKITAWYIIPYEPKFLRLLNLTKKEDGIYLLNFSFKFYIVIIDKFPTKFENIPFLMFSSKERLREILKLIIQEKSLQRYLSVSYLLYPKVLKELTSKEDYYTYKEIQDNIKFAVEELGVKNVVEAVGLEKVVEAVGLEKVVEAIGLEKVIEAIGLEKVVEAIGLEKVVEAIGLEKIEKIINKIKSKMKK